MMCLTFIVSKYVQMKGVPLNVGLEVNNLLQNTYRERMKMKKILVMLLLVSMSFSTVACGGNDSVTNHESTNAVNQENNENTSNNSDSESYIDYEEILLADGDFWEGLHGFPLHPICFLEDYTCINDMVEIGTWKLTGTTVTILEDDITTSYEIKDVNGEYLLVGDYDIFYNLSNADEIDIPIKEVEVTIDNWQDYFEVCSYSTEYGEKYRLKLRDEYFKKFIYNLRLDIISYTNLQYEISDIEMEYGYLSFDENSGPVYFGCEVDEPDFEMTKIQGTLYFIDIE